LKNRKKKEAEIESSEDELSDTEIKSELISSADELKEFANTNHETTPIVFHFPINTVQPKAPKQHRGKSKARRKRGVFLDADGSAKIEMSKDHKGKVNVVGEDVTFSKGALPEAAQNVVFKHQFRRKHQATEEDFEDNEYDEDHEIEEKPKQHTASLSDFLSSTEKSSDLPPVNIPNLKLEALSNVELLEQLDKNDLDNYSTVKSNCQRLNAQLISATETLVNETELASVLSLIERINIAIHK